MPSPLLPPLTGTALASPSSPSTSASSRAPAPHTRYLIGSPAEGAVFHPHPSLSIAAAVTAQSAGVGLLVSAVQNALDQWVHRGVWDGGRESDGRADGTDITAERWASLRAREGPSPFSVGVA